MRRIQGVVVSTGGAETAIIRVDSTREHPRYRKKYRVSHRIAVHDPEGQARLGASVVAEECRPISKTKRFRLLEVLGGDE